ncbi:sensor histidine kinase [Pseudooceanicola nanhaiensis]|uniref:sensor histidine kinase n=1 Tax=Pseudooceanicola nanhaiensis TaxID=375761 RepID=UPI001CD3DB4F|nr:sensor histidine kinase [Pseudooceanicola nanhaiensis]MCA0922742.1 sensor histidine kinase [Pseudooceanicola nanhaiensis]
MAERRPAASPPLRRRVRSPASIQIRVTGSVLALLLVGGVAVAIASLAYGRQAARQSYDRLLLGAAQDIAESITIVTGGPVTALPLSAFELLAQAPDDRIFYAVRDAGGALLTGQEDVTPAGASREAREARARDRSGPVFYDARMQGEKARFVTVPRRFAERDYSGVVSVTVGQTMLARNDMAYVLTRDALIAAGVLGLMLMGLSVLVIRSALRPMERIADEMLARDPYDLTPIVTPLPAELSVMTEAMNRFMGRLDRQVGAMRNLISDTAHQLRTPVAALRAQAELALEEEDVAKRQQMVARLAARTRSLGELLDQMLSRALVIHRTDSAPRLAIDLRDVALEAVESGDHQLLAPGAELELLIGEEEVCVLADEMSLQEAAKNMLSNALRHGLAPVRIGVSTEGREAVLWVEDSGPGPEDDLMARIGNRFERAAAARGQSAGLGLSIVQAVATAFGGRLTMARSENGFRVALRLPLPEETQ